MLTGVPVNGVFHAWRRRQYVERAKADEMMVSHVDLMLIVRGEFVCCQKLHVPVQIVGQHHGWRTVRDMNVVRADIVPQRHSVHL